MGWGRGCLGSFLTLSISRSYLLTSQTCVIDRVTIYSSFISLIDKLMNKRGWHNDWSVISWVRFPLEAVFFFFPQ